MRKSFMLEKGQLFVIILVLICFHGIVVAQRDVIQFDRISVEDGLSQNTIYTILQDHKGFMWFGTEDGLNRFDGLSFKNYFNLPGHKGSISNSRVIALLEDSKNTLWVGTIGGGLNKYDWKTDSFVVFKHNPDDSNSLSNDRVMVLKEDPSGRLWVGTADGGLNLFDPESETFIVYKNTLDNPDLLPSNVIRSLFFDSKGVLWVGTDRGIAKYNSENDSFEKLSNIFFDGELYNLKTIRSFLEDNEGNIWIATDEEGLIKQNVGDKSYTIIHRNSHISNSIPSNTLHDLYQDDQGFIWIATYGGLSRLDPSTNELINYYHSLYDSKSIASNLVRTIYEDRHGIMWIGTSNNGISKFNRKAKGFNSYRNFPGNKFNLPSTQVRTIIEDNEGSVWIGTFGEGLIKLNLDNEEFTYYISSRHKEGNQPNNFIISATRDKSGCIWFGTNNGLAKYIESSNTFKSIGVDTKKENYLPDRRIRHVYADSNNEIWVATLNNGLSRLQSDGNLIITYRYDPNDSKTISQDRVTSIFEDIYGNFWIGTSSEGLNLFNRQEGAVSKLYRKEDRVKTSIASNRIFCFYQDSKGRLWIGTAEGLSLFNYEKEEFASFTVLDGLPNNVIYGILEDEKGRLWLSTNNGISCLDLSNPINPVFRNFDKFDGLPVNEFSEGAYCRLSSGEMMFGGLNSFVLFNPLDIKDDLDVPIVYITEARVTAKNRGLAETHERIINLLENDYLVFNHTQNNVELFITVINHIAPQKSRYRYMLDGFDNTWVEPSSLQQFVKYTNLKPGKYTFNIIASNYDGQWSEVGDSFHFVITPPFWNKWWFYVFISLVFAVSMFALVQLRETRLIKAKQILEYMVSERTQELSSQSSELMVQSEMLKQANEEIRSTSEAIAEQNELLLIKNEEITKKNVELEDQKNSLANLAWELQDKNEEITAHRNEIEKQKKEITDSIMYAQRIQEAVLPTQEQIRDLFPSFFIFNRPKSIVSGDFYWATRIGNYRVVAVVDCTGHGVPGGFMSMLGVLMLNEVISLRAILDPAKALNQLRQGIISVLHQKGEFTDAADGMDLSLCIIDNDTLTLSYSGANSSIIIFEPMLNGIEGINILRSDRMPIAYHPLMKSFSTQTYKLTKESILFLFSDGIIDQFGGDTNKKFQQTRLVDFILESKDLPIETQGIVLEQQFDKWMGSSYQVDDVLVMGLKI